MNKEHFIKKAQETTPEEFAAGWIYLGIEPSKFGLRDFRGVYCSHRESLYKQIKESEAFLLGDATSHYAMSRKNWERIFGPFSFKTKDKASLIKDKILNLKNELDLAEEELKKIEEEKKIFKGHETMLQVRGKILPNGSRVSRDFGAIRCQGELAYEGIFLGNPNISLSSAKWKIVIDSLGCQVLIPDLEK